MRQKSTLTKRAILTGGMLSLSAGLLAQEPTNTAAAPAAADAVSAPSQSQQGSAAPVAQEDREVSQVRIVRLSQVRGSVQMDRNTGRGFEPAFANIPVVAGSRLRTGQGVAEVEFEDNSSLRLAPDSEVRFGRLGRLATGSTATDVEVSKGIVYVSLEKTRGNEFALHDGSAQMNLAPGAHLRLAADESQAQLAVFDGSAQLVLGSSITSLAKRQTVLLSPSAQTVSAVTRGTEEGDWDGWDKQEVSYHQQKANVANVGGFGLYGANDLNYYGAFSDLPGCGSVWRPYFASAAWDPFASGLWAYYPTGGYSWVSPYPWGWLPYHSGSWQSCGSAGWGWRPGGSWYGVQNRQALRLANHPLPYPVAPTTGKTTASLVPVNMHLLSASGVNERSEFTFRRDSAGFGVPRAAFGNLYSFAQHVDRAGAVTRPVPEGMITIPSTLAARGPAEGGLPRSGMQAGVQGTGGTSAQGMNVPRVSSTHGSTGAFHSSVVGTTHSSSMSPSGSRAVSSPSMSSTSTMGGGSRGGSSGASASAPSGGSHK